MIQTHLLLQELLTQAEIGEYHVAITVQQYVLKFNVSVHNAKLQTMWKTGSCQEVTTVWSHIMTTISQYPELRLHTDNGETIWEKIGEILVGR